MVDEERKKLFRLGVERRNLMMLDAAGIQAGDLLKPSVECIEARYGVAKWQRWYYRHLRPLVNYHAYNVALLKYRRERERKESDFLPTVIARGVVAGLCLPGEFEHA